MYKGIISILVIFLSFSSCNSDIIVISDIVAMHENCLNEALILPNSSSEENIKICGFLDGHAFGVSSDYNEFIFDSYFTSKFVTNSSSAEPSNNGQSNFIDLMFDSKRINFSFGLRVPIQNDIHQAFLSFFSSDDKFYFSSNLEEGLPEVYFNPVCDYKAMDLSTLYSTRSNQFASINRFKFFPSGIDSITYQLSFSAENLEIASEQFNDFDNPSTLALRGTYNPVYNLMIDSCYLEFTLPR